MSKTLYNKALDIFKLRAIDGIRTRDPDLGKVVLYQLSHYRVCCMFPDRNNNYYTTWGLHCQQLFPIFLNLCEVQSEPDLQARLVKELTLVLSPILCYNMTHEKFAVRYEV